MLFHHPQSRVAPDRHALTFGHIRQQFESLSARMRHQNFLSRPQNGVQAFPVITHNRSCASRSLKQSDTRRISDAPHLSACEVQSKSLGGVKSAMPAGGDVDNLSDVTRPCNVLRVL